MNEVLCDFSARLGHEMKLKDEQNQAIEHLLCSRDVLVVLPSGWGNCLFPIPQKTGKAEDVQKSKFQLPAMF